jgi:hypothetical protein
MCLGACNGDDGCFMDCFKRGNEPPVGTNTNLVKTGSGTPQTSRTDDIACTNCGNVNDTPCFKTCLNCRRINKRARDKRKANGVKATRTPDQERRYRQRQKNKYDDRRESGLCPMCGKYPPFGYTLCVSCTESDRKSVEVRVADGLCWKCGKPNTSSNKTCPECIEKSVERQRVGRQELRDEVFAAYGGYVCACCGETNPGFLQLDHMHNDGREHRRSVGVSGVYRDLRDRGFPPGFQVLCSNCNWGKSQNGGVCPHHNKTLNPPVGEDYVI